MNQMLTSLRHSSRRRQRRAVGASAVAGSGLLLVALFLLPLLPPFSFIYSGALAILGILAILTVAGAIVGFAVL